ncbi:MAG: succinate dehydrogenase cytochrome b subunit [Actinobacteria bacterium]|nr:succinate dehydrogenase cytochrome b subunit [Actinomycetota bacterium]
MKILMAVTGLFFVFFVLFHMYGNLKMFAGPEAYNGYAEHLRVMFEPILPRMGLLWILRVLLLASVLVHAWAAFSLWDKARRARGTVGYVNRHPVATTYAARTMRWGGVLILAFVVFHLLHFTTLHIEIGGDYQALSPYERMIVSFEHWWLWLAYGVVMVLLAMHVRHGLWSSMATLGANQKRRQLAINVIALVAATLLVVGFMLPPTAILLDIIN